MGFIYFSFALNFMFLQLAYAKFECSFTVTPGYVTNDIIAGAGAAGVEQFDLHHCAWICSQSEANMGIKCNSATVVGGSCLYTSNTFEDNPDKFSTNSSALYISDIRDCTEKEEARKRCVEVSYALSFPGHLHKNPLLAIEKSTNFTVDDCAFKCGEIVQCKFASVKGKVCWLSSVTPEESPDQFEFDLILDNVADISELNCITGQKCVDEEETCAFYNSDDCRSTDGYSGRKSKTRTGKTCQAWNKQSPHQHSYHEYGDSNYCRTSEGELAPWCYTTDNDTRWEWCFDNCLDEEAEKEIEASSCLKATYEEKPEFLTKKVFHIDYDSGDVENCAARCAGVSGCKSASFSWNIGCQMSSTTLEETPSSFDTVPSTGIVYIYNIKCKDDQGTLPTGGAGPTTGTQKPDILNSMSGEGAKPRKDLTKASNIDAGHRVIGGENSYVNAWPWLGSFQLIGEQTEPNQYLKGHACGALLIRTSMKHNKSDLILTAGHCLLTGMDEGDVELRFGEHNLLKRDRHEQASYAKKIYVHEDYDRDNQENDIMAITLETPIEFRRGAQPIAIPRPSDKVPDSKKCFVAGWGKTSMESRQAPTLQEVVLPIVDHLACKTTFEDNKDPIAQRKLLINDENMVCAGYTDGKTKKDTCKGDSGGPLMCTKGNSKRFYLQGLTSFGLKTCGDGKAPGIYTRVSSYCHWILEKICKESTIPGHDDPIFCDKAERCK